MNNDHNPEENNIDIQTKKISNSIKRLAIENICEWSSKLIQCA